MFARNDHRQSFLLTMRFLPQNRAALHSAVYHPFDIFAAFPQATKRGPRFLAAAFASACTDGTAYDGSSFPSRPVADALALARLAELSQDVVLPLGSAI